MASVSIHHFQLNPCQHQCAMLYCMGHYSSVPVLFCPAALRQFACASTTIHSSLLYCGQQYCMMRHCTDHHHATIIPKLGVLCQHICFEGRELFGNKIITTPLHATAFITVGAARLPTHWSPIGDVRRQKQSARTPLKGNSWSSYLPLAALRTASPTAKLPLSVPV